MTRCIEQILITLNIFHWHAARFIRRKTHFPGRFEIIEIKSFTYACGRNVQSLANAGVVHAHFRVFACCLVKIRHRFVTPGYIQIVQRGNFRIRKSVNIEIKIVEVDFGRLVRILTTVRYCLTQ